MALPDKVFAILDGDQKSDDAADILKPGATIKREGVDDGGKLTVLSIDRDRRLMAVKRAGCSVWSGTGQPWTYSPAEIVVFAFYLSQKGNFATVSVDYSPIMRWPAKGVGKTS